jgi:HrpA-like RNA helicase
MNSQIATLPMDKKLARMLLTAMEYRESSYDRGG